MKKRVVVVEGEDASPEAVRPTVALIDRMGLDIEWLTPPIGLAALEQGLPPFSEAAKAAIDGSDATLFGSASRASVPALLYLRWGKQTYANVRPSRYVKGARTPLAHPEGIDLVIVRENTEDLYVGVEGDIADLASLGLTSNFTGKAVSELGAGRYALKIITEDGTRRVCKSAFELARRRKAEGRPGKVTSATKHNRLMATDGLFRSICQEVAKEFSDIEFESLIADDVAHRLVVAPTAFDVLVMPNLYGDLFSDLAAGLVGGLGLAPSGCYGDDYAYFESVHGTAPDIAGKNCINPTATILSAALMLEHLGFAKEAKRLEQATFAVYADGATLTPDQGGTSTTTEFCSAIARALGV